MNSIRTLCPRPSQTHAQIGGKVPKGPGDQTPPPRCQKPLKFPDPPPSHRQRPHGRRLPSLTCHLFTLARSGLEPCTAALGPTSGFRRGSGYWLSTHRSLVTRLHCHRGRLTRLRISLAISRMSFTLPGGVFRTIRNSPENGLLANPDGRSPEGVLPAPSQRQGHLVDGN